MDTQPDQQKAQQRAQLRRQLRQQRRELDAETQLRHGAHLYQQLRHCDLYRRSKRIAAYLPEDGEIDSGYIIHNAWRAKKQIYLPVLSPFGNSLYFAPFQRGSAMRKNRFGIPEPDSHPRHWLRARQLDLILMPLVGFDKQGNRLGMGGGFYDRTLAFTRYQANSHRPYLIGLAHQLQQVDALDYQPHDIAMQLIATEQGIIYC